VAGQRSTWVQAVQVRYASYWRVKLYGRMVKGSLSDGDEGQAQAQVFVHIEESQLQ
jgi:hypothetical protein